MHSQCSTVPHFEPVLKLASPMFDICADKAADRKLQLHAVILGSLQNSQYRHQPTTFGQSRSELWRHATALTDFEYEAPTQDRFWYVKVAGL